MCGDVLIWNRTNLFEWLRWLPVQRSWLHAVGAAVGERPSEEKVALNSDD